MSDAEALPGIRSSDVSETPPGFAVAAPNIATETPKEFNAQSIKLSQISSFSEAIVAVPEIDKAIRLARVSGSQLI